MLTGGGSTRMGEHKADVRLGGRRLVDRLLDQIPAEVPVVVVGPDPHVQREVMVTREEPPGAGPAAAITAGAAAAHTPVVAVMAVDMPFCMPVVTDLSGDLAGFDAVVPVAAGHRQGLAALYRTAALLDATVPPGSSVAALLDQLNVRCIDRPEELLADIDDPEQLRAAEQRLTIMERDAKEGAMQEWIDAVTRELGVSADVDVDSVLDVARDAAHAVARPAAPVTTYLMGFAAASGIDPRLAAERIADLAASWPQQPDA